LIGRDTQLAAVRRALVDRDTHGVVVTGRSGVGKTALARAAMAAAATHGAMTHWVRATTTSATIPLGAMAHLLPASQDLSTDRARLLLQVAQHLTRSAAGAPVVLCVDDAHLLDSISAALVHQLVANGTVFALLTVPYGVDVPDPVFTLWKDRVADRLDLPDLTRAQTAELAAAALRAPLDPAAEQQLWQLTLGNPLFVRELLQGAQEGDALTEVDGRVRWSGAVTATRRLVELIERRTDRPDPNERTLLEVIALGGPVGSEVVVRMGGARALATAEREGLVVSERHGRRLDVRLAHPLYAQVIRGRTSPLRQRRVYLALVGGLEQTGARRAEDRLRLVDWRMAAGLQVDPQDMCAVARSMAGTDPVRAELLAGGAVQAGGGPTARLLLAEIAAGTGRHEVAEAELAELAEAALTGGQVVRISATRAANLALGLGDPAAARGVLAAASAAVPATEQDELDLAAAEIALVEGTVGVATDLLGRVLDHARSAGPLRLRALVASAEALLATGRYPAAIAASEEAVAMSGRVSDPARPAGRARLIAAHAAALVATGRPDAADELLAAEAVDGERPRRAWLSALRDATRGRIALSGGRVGTAARLLERAVNAARTPGAAVDQPFGVLPALLGDLVIAMVQAGRPADAARVLDRGLPKLPADHPLAAWHLAAARAWLAAAAGQSSQAAEIIARAAGAARRDGRPADELTLLHDLVRFGTPRPAVDRLAELAGRVPGPLPGLYLAHARALAGSDAGALDQVAGDLADAGRLLPAAEASAQAARLHRAAGRTGSAGVSTARARSWQEACEQARTPALDALGTPRELTVRELEIARLAATGLTSKAIAGQLVVSVRTVDNVLHGVYAKLGIGGRGELVEVLGMADGPERAGASTT
jgi:DNA-binding CsgD family transcriptional regulator